MDEMRSRISFFVKNWLTRRGSHIMCVQRLRLKDKMTSIGDEIKNLEDIRPAKVRERRRTSLTKTAHKLTVNSQH